MGLDIYVDELEKSKIDNTHTIIIKDFQTSTLELLTNYKNEYDRINDDLRKAYNALDIDYCEEPYYLDMIISNLKSKTGQYLDPKSLSPKELSFYKKICYQEMPDDIKTKLKINKLPTKEIFYARKDYVLCDKLAKMISKLSNNKIDIDTINGFSILLTPATQPLFDLIDFQKKETKTYLLLIWY